MCVCAYARRAYRDFSVQLCHKVQKSQCLCGFQSGQLLGTMYGQDKPSFLYVKRYRGVVLFLKVIVPQIELGFQACTNCHGLKNA